MQRWFRNTHLVLGLLSSSFLLMYGISSVQMAHRPWFSAKPDVTVANVAVRSAEASGARALARALMRRGLLAGEVTNTAVKPFGYQVRVVRPGTVQDVKYVRESGIAEITTNRSNFLFVLNRLHHLAGVRHDYVPVNFWGGVLGLVSAMLIALALTGIYLWFKMHGERLAGSVILAISLGYSLTLIVLMRLA